MPQVFFRYHFPVIDSTNTWAKRNVHLFDPDKITLVSAKEQTAGRGRIDHHWESPPTNNIYASFCFVIPPDNPSPNNLSQIMALTAARVARMALTAVQAARVVKMALTVARTALTAVFPGRP